MTDCDLCGDLCGDHHTVLRNASFDNGTFQMLRSRMVVCPDCHTKMADSEDWNVD